ncbi:hypothetical protein [Cohnella herbarum]|uniref:Uncharacterized protein n=1 Tax=Cohnella herbarum TaxID=2728023 RepID=A0A7Z2VEX8_9BACL|nr:hypothetical protein [Cohnella herbarum]QJD81956.1 hypothetical protein HH215_01335 [Cohnella herbarum]
MSNRSNFPVIALVGGLMCMGLSIALTSLALTIVFSVAGFAGIALGIRGIIRMK